MKRHTTHPHVQDWEMIEETIGDTNMAIETSVYIMQRRVLIPSPAKASPQYWSSSKEHVSPRKSVFKNHTTRSIIRSGILLGLLLFVMLPVSQMYGVRILRAAHYGMNADTYSTVPVPDPSIQISVIIMNHSRPKLLQNSNLLRTVTAHPNVQEVLLLHSNPLTAFDDSQLHLPDTSLAKIKHIDASQMDRQIGLAIRFHYCSQASNNWIMHVDDDMELEGSAISVLINSMHDNPHRIVGRFGRQYDMWRAPNRHGYDTTDIYGTAEVVLTKLLMLERVICEEFMEHVDVVSDLVPQSSPTWNGEDIFVNLIANHYYKVPTNGPYNNYAIKNLKVWEADTSKFEENSVSGNMDRNRIWQVGPMQFYQAYQRAQAHTLYRGILWDTAKQRLAAMAA